MAPSRSRNTCRCVSPIRQKDITRNRYATSLELAGILSRVRRLVKCSERSVRIPDVVPVPTPADVLGSSLAFGS